MSHTQNLEPIFPALLIARILQSILDKDKDGPGILDQQCLENINSTIKTIETSIKKEANAHLHFSYFSKDDPRRKTLPYPPDMDDTSVAWSVLYHHKTISPETWSKIIKNIVKVERAEKSALYYTWIVDEKDREVWPNTDIVVNCNLQYFLNQHGIRIDKIDAYIDKLELEDIRSDYYHDKLLIFYFLAKAAKESQKSRISRLFEKTFSTKSIQENKQIKDSQTNNLVSKALYIIAKITLEDVTTQDKFLMQSIQQDIESIAASSSDINYPFYIEQIEDGRVTYAYSHALSMTIMLEAMFLIGRQKNLEKVTLAKSPYSKLDFQRDFPNLSHKAGRVGEAGQKLYKKIKGPITAQRLSHTSGLIEEIVFDIVENIYTPASTEPPSPIAQQTLQNKLERLAGANLIAWSAFRLLDDVLDEERFDKDRRLRNDSIVLANRLILHSQNLFISLVPRSDKKETRNAVGRDVVERYVVDRIIKSYDITLDAIMDEMNHMSMSEAHEQSPAKQKISGQMISSQKIYKISLEKSYGATLAPALAYYIAAPRPILSDFDKIQRIFGLLFYIKQLNDDFHDWRTDLENGVLNSASFRYVKGYIRRYIKPGYTGQRHTVSTSEKLDGLNEIEERIWDNYPKIFQKEIEASLKEAEKILADLTTHKIFKNTDFIMEKFASLAKIAKDIIQTKKDGEKIIEILEKEKVLTV